MKRTNLRLLEKGGIAGLKRLMPMVLCLLFIMAFQFSSVSQALTSADFLSPFPPMKDRITAISTIQQELQSYQPYKNGTLALGNPGSFMLRARIMARVKEIAETSSNATTEIALAEAFFDTNVGYLSNPSPTSFYTGVWPDEYKYVVNLLRRY